MKHLETLNGVQELSNNELKNTDGGAVIGIDCAVIGVVAAGVALGIGIAYVTR